jgi:ATP-dependent exoDNAse (exonuclease V) beta subunit
MKLLAQNNKNHRDKNLTFNEAEHIYYYNNEVFKSVTTWISSLFEKFDQEKIILKMMSSKSFIKNELYGKTKEQIEELWSMKNKKAIEEGVNLHNDIENYLNNETVNNTTIEFVYFQNFLREHLLNVYRTEWAVYDERLKLAGTIDMCAMNSNGSLSLYDWKRTKAIKKVNYYKKYSTLETLHYFDDTNFNHYALQLNLYKYILEKNYNFKVSSMYLVCLHPENKNNDYLMFSVPVMNYEIEQVLNYIKNNI